MIDHHGYPTEETLQKIASFNPLKDDVIEFTEYLCLNWVNGFAPEWNLEEQTLKLGTGGWCGCELVIAALEKSSYWTLFWYSSRRGGHYEFQNIRNMKKTE